MRLSESSGVDLLSDDSPFFLVSKEKRMFDKSDGLLFKSKGMNAGHFKNLVYNMCMDSGIKMENRKITNTSLRVTAFHNQENAGIDAVSAQQFSGHINPSTAAMYRRKNQETSSHIGGSMAEAITGSLAIKPEASGKLLTKNLLLNN